ncbi:MAG: UDP-N-acetylmuramate--L-alanine ligase [Solobacterium sp.]|nr:UDP-N-acetylmuramate--L-alanine ligase [Solobacterium sp.]
MYYFIGIKGTGMAALACLLDDLGYEVKGSDFNKHFFPEDQLRERGIEILDFDEHNIQDNMNVIIGNAFLDDFPEVAAARSNPTCTCLRYHEFVGKFIEPYETIAAAGSHGKTTTTGMLACMMQEKGPTGYLIGDGDGSVAKDTKYFCLEADEFQRHFIAYYPEYAIITNVDLDHVDYFKDLSDYDHAYEEFSAHVKKAIIIYGEDEEARKLKLSDQVPHYWYGEAENDDIRATDITETKDGMSFTVSFKGEKFGEFSFPFVGHHLLLNSLACIGVGILEGMSAEEIERGLSRFHGRKRRFVVETIGDSVVIDDYAHHPTEVGVTLDAARTRFPDHKIVAIVKPHRASRVKYFADEFASALHKADAIYLLEFTSYDDKQDGTDIDIHYLEHKTTGSRVIDEGESGAKELFKEAPACFVFMSSKDIYTLRDGVKELLRNEE